MLDSLSTGALVGGLVASFAGFMAVRRATYLEGKLAALRRQLLIQGLALLVSAITLFAASRLGREVLPLRLPNGPLDAVAMWPVQAAVADALRRLGMWCGGFALLAVCTLPSLLHVLRELQSFALAQRTDLLARDQVMAQRVAP